ncbi:hypothetical protein SAMN02799624_02506 [Paenibacillus sp. UNC496MF]|uniref:hypothetical protein n=1 Tax=Paenibacillus sp. UNC496MF TaxID=1502753 RepID=UPI0008F2E0D3|nr:hypothetical protein [Paenibacillus sp. UNC496MF]SFI88761.1 hypothetical protein SAMN02799624_02506 [Paenibacillus sp. UNC496MF]
MGRLGRGRRLPVLQLFVGAVIVAVIGLAWHNAKRLLPGSDSEGALQAVEQFYRFEQAGDFGSAWELFHPLMQQRFDKAGYIQKRAHVMMQDFGVDTFDVELGAAKAVADWRMDAAAAPIPKVYQVPVTETFYSPYGNFQLVQNCFAAYEAGAWKLLWSYQADPAQAQLAGAK